MDATLRIQHIHHGLVPQYTVYSRRPFQHKQNQHEVFDISKRKTDKIKYKITKFTPVLSIKTIFDLKSGRSEL